MFASSCFIFKLGNEQVYLRCVACCGLSIRVCWISETCLCWIHVPWGELWVAYSRLRLLWVNMKGNETSWSIKSMDVDDGLLMSYCPAGVCEAVFLCSSSLGPWLVRLPSRPSPFVHTCVQGAVSPSSQGHVHLHQPPAQSSLGQLVGLWLYKDVVGLLTAFYLDVYWTYFALSSFKRWTFSEISCICLFVLYLWSSNSLFLTSGGFKRKEKHSVLKIFWIPLDAIVIKF